MSYSTTAMNEQRILKYKGVNYQKGLNDPILGHNELTSPRRLQLAFPCGHNQRTPHCYVPEKGNKKNPLMHKTCLCSRCVFTVKKICRDSPFMNIIIDLAPCRWLFMHSQSVDISNNHYMQIKTTVCQSTWKHWAAEHLELFINEERGHTLTTGYS